MKRGAQRQLTRDDDDMDGDDRDEDEEPQRGLQKADTSTLSNRPMKGLPKRRSVAPATSAAVPPPPAPDAKETSPPPRFPGFVGFGSGSSFTTTTSSENAASQKFSGFSGFGAKSSNPFSAGVAIAPPTPAAVPSSGSAFPFGTSSSTTSSTSATGNGPAVSSSASQATKNFASFLGSGTTNGATTTGKIEKAGGDEDALLKEEVDYLSHIRGLNMSLLTTVKTAIEIDPFVDVGSILEMYKSLRLTEKKKFDEKVGDLKGSATKEADKSITTTILAKSGGLPRGPGLFEFGKSSSSSSASSPPASSSQPFVFGAGSSGSSSSAKGVGFSSLGKGRPSEDRSSDAPASSASPFSFAATAPAANPFGKPADKDTGMDENKSTFPSSTSSNSASGGPFSGPTPSSSGSTLFGGSSTPSAFSTPTSFTTPEKSSSSGFTFDSTTPPKFAISGAAPSQPNRSSFGAFPRAAALGSIGNPVGFGFGSPPKDSDDSASSSSSNAPKPFLFGPPKDKPAEETKTEGAAESKDQEATGDEPPPMLITGSIHDKEGEGEEHETTTHEIKSKVYKMVKDEDGQSRWADQGVGMLRLKKHNETDARRMLLRNSSTGKVVINFRIYSGMNARADKNVVSFVGHEDGAQATYRIRTKTEEQATDLKSAVDREIEFVRAKSPSS
ncbi:hypothetical protein EVJ58_g5075 [Rhodofomes roseus]|uniref:RanBD1 domain-containing protein n=1 Tax=Rhodofomes roseus TaxID=34475 RepID=A0A4Y9YFC4_9APHY|nr:hypothetical protein EVJ58_g5075 [Rhodofomes roseus]